MAEPVALPDDLAARGWKLIIRAPDRLFAVSESWGCTTTQDSIGAVIREAYSMCHFIEWAKKQPAL